MRVEILDLTARIFASSAEAMIFSDRDGVIVLWNDAAAALLGYTEAEVIGRRVDVLIPSEYHDRHWAGYARAMATGKLKSARGVVPMIARSAERIRIAYTGSLVFDDDGRVIGIASIWRPAI